MSIMKFYMLDVFGEARYSGNQLAVFLARPGLSGEEMQRIAREINFSETTFILSGVPRDDGYDVRIFTPAAELDFAGHPTLGTAFVIRSLDDGRPADEVRLNLKVAQIPVRFEGEAGEKGLAWMRQAEPTFGRSVDPAAAAAALGLRVADLDDRWPVEQVSTGLPQTIIPLRSFEALGRIALDRPAYESLVSGAWAKVVLAFASGGYQEGQSLGARVFPVALGIPEDPATGSGIGALGAFLLRHRVLGPGALDLRIGQGYEIGRPSVLHLRAEEQDGRFDIRVGGRIIPVAEGIWKS